VFHENQSYASKADRNLISSFKTEKGENNVIFKQDTSQCDKYQDTFTDRSNYDL